MNAPNLLVVPVTRATAPSNMSKAAPRVPTMPASSHHWTAAKTAATPAMPNPMSVSLLAVRPAAAIRLRDGLDALRIASRRGVVLAGGWRGGGRGRGGAADRVRGHQIGHPQHHVLLLMEALQRVARERADDLSARAARLDQAGHLEPAQVPRDERLRQVHEVDEVRHGRRLLRQPGDDPQARGVRERLVHDGRLEQVLRRRGDGGDRGADAGGAGHEGWWSPVRDGSTKVYIKPC